MTTTTPTERQNKRFSVRVVHSGSEPLGPSIPGDHSFFMLSAYESGKESCDLEVGEGGCIHRATTADGKHTEGGRSVPILYAVTRLA